MRMAYGAEVWKPSSFFGPDTGLAANATPPASVSAANQRQGAISRLNKYLSLPKIWPA
jgi:hypothetical protein